MLGSTGFVRGVNTVYLEFELPTPGDRDWSELLAEAFEQVHTGADTEFAFIHPKTGLDDLTDGAYDPPVTVGPLFRGVLWANLLGADLLDEFELKALRGLPAENLRHDPASRSLWFYGADSIAGATQDEDRLVALTQAVRAALRPESRFSG